MTRGRLVRVVAGGSAIAVLSTSLALAATQQTYSQKFTVKRPGQPTGMTFKASARDPKNPLGHLPVQVRKVTLTFPAGTKIDTKAVARCVNENSCPAGSQIGSGTAVVQYSTTRTPITAKVYNRAGGLFIIFTTPIGTTVLKPVLKGTQLTLTVPPLKVGQITLVLTDMTLTIKKAGTGSHPYTRTPSSCPKSHVWTFRARFDYVNKTVKKLTSTSACTKH